LYALLLLFLTVLTLTQLIGISSTLSVKQGEAPLPKIIKKYRRERDNGSSDVLSSDW
jgi:hypothetical protein